MKRNWIESGLAVAAFCLSLAIYIRTLAPTVTFTDSGELAVDCITLGVAHPTGYPLFTILGHLWTLLPIPATPIYKLNLFAAVCTSLSVVMFYKVALLILRRLNARELPPSPVLLPVGATASPASNPRGGRPSPAARRRGNRRPASSSERKSWFSETGSSNPISEAAILTIALASALAYAFARTIWQQATAIEVYSLHLLMVLTVLWLFLKAVWAQTPKTRDFLVFALVLGLAFGNHLSTIWLIPGLLVFYLMRLGFRKHTGILLLAMIAPFALGLSVYLYLPLRSGGYFPFHGPPHFDWGGVGRSWAKLLFHISGKWFSDRMFDGNWPGQLKALRDVCLYQVAVIGVVPILFGIWRAFRQNKELLLFLMILAATCIGLAINYDIFDIESYFALAFIAALLLMTIGFLALAQWRKPLALAACLIPAIAIGLNFKENDRSQDHLVQDFTRNLVDNLEPNAVIISGQWDYFMSPFWYYQNIEGLRPDITVIDSRLLKVTWYLPQLRRWYPELMKQSDTESRAYEANLDVFESGKPYDGDQLQTRYLAFVNSLIDNSMKQHPVYFTEEVMSDDKGIGSKYRVFPAGLAMRFAADSNAAPTWNTDFHFERFLKYTPDPTDRLERGIYTVAADGVKSSAQLQQMLGHSTSSAGLSALADQLSAKVAQK